VRAFKFRVAVTLYSLPILLLAVSLAASYLVLYFATLPMDDFPGEFLPQSANCVLLSQVNLLKSESQKKGRERLSKSLKPQLFNYCLSPIWIQHGEKPGGGGQLHSQITFCFLGFLPFPF